MDYNYFVLSLGKLKDSRIVSVEEEASHWRSYYGAFPQIVFSP
jgi:hypothetical protein